MDWIVLDKNYMLCDGYASYIVAMEKHIDTVRCAIGDFVFNGYIGTVKDITKMLKNGSANYELKHELTDEIKDKSKKKLEKMEKRYGKEIEYEWEGAITQKRKYEIFLKANGKCPICGNPLMFMVDEAPDKYRLSVDHNIPKSHGGKNSSENCVAMCRRCNTFKTDIMPDVFRNQFKSAMAEEVLRNPEYQNLILRKIFKNKIMRRMAGIKATLL